MMTDKDKERMGVSVASVLYGYSVEERKAILQVAQVIAAHTSIVSEKIEHAGSNVAGCVNASFHY